MSQGYAERVQFAQEETWGTLPATPTWTDVVLTGAGFRPKDQCTRHMFQPAHRFPYVEAAIPIAIPLDASLETPLYQATVLDILDMGMKRTSGQGNFYTFMMQKADATLHKFSGMAARTFTLRGDLSGPVMATFEMAGKEWAAGAALQSPSWPSPPPYMGVHTVLKVDGSPVTGLESFDLSVENNLQIGPAGATLSPTYIEWGMQNIRLSWKQKWGSPDYPAKIRANTSCAITIELNRQATDSETVTISIPTFYIEEAPEEASDRQAVVTASISGVAVYNVSGTITYTQE